MLKTIIAEQGHREIRIKEQLIIPVPLLVLLSPFTPPGHCRQPGTQPPELRSALRVRAVPGGGQGGSAQDGAQRVQRLHQRRPQHPVLPRVVLRERMAKLLMRWGKQCETKTNREAKTSGEGGLGPALRDWKARLGLLNEMNSRRTCNLGSIVWLPACKASSKIRTCNSRYPEIVYLLHYKRR